MEHLVHRIGIGIVPIAATQGIAPEMLGQISQKLA